jgi:serine/threonine protein kinase, bacterial
MDVHMKLNPVAALVLGVACLVINACGGGNGGGTPTPSSPPPSPPSATVTGSAAKGLLLNAIVSFYSVTDGAAGSTAVASVRTDPSTGAFTSPVSSSGPVLVVVTVDSTTKMLDEVSGVAITAPSGLVLHTVFDSLTNLQPIAVTPLTELAYDIAKASSGGLITANIDAANNAVGETFLAGASVLYTLPIDLKNYKSATVAQQEQAKLLAALAVAANAGTAVNASGGTCTGAYSANLVCMVGGIGSLLTLNSSGTPTLGAAATYLAAAYASITSGTVTLEGGQLPSALGLNVATAAETAFETAVTKQVPFPGYVTGGTALGNTKAFFADVRTNIVDATSQTIGYAPDLTALQADAQTSVAPVLVSTASLLSAARVAAQLITAGNGGGGTRTPYSSAGGPGGIAIEASGDLLVSYANNTIGQLTPAGAYTLYAGIPSAIGASNGPALQATFNGSYGVAVDGKGNVYVADAANNVIRKIAGGVVSTFAGTGVAGSADGPAATASFSSPEGIAVDSSGNVYVADSYNNTIRKITISGGVATVSTYAGTANLDGAFTDGTGTAAGFSFPYDLAVDANGNVYVADTGNAAVRYITPAVSPAGVGVVCTLAGPAGNTCSSSGPKTSAGFIYPDGIAVDSSLNVYVADSGTATINAITPAPAGGVVSLLAGTTGTGGDTDGTTGAASSFRGPSGIKADGHGNLYVADYGNRSIRKVATSNGATTTIQQGTGIYQSINGKGTCGWDPVGLSTAANVALCRYGGLKDAMLLTLTQTGSGTYTLQTQALQVSPTQTQVLTGNPNPVNPVYGFAFYSIPNPSLGYTQYGYDAFTVNLTIPALSANLALTESATTPVNATLSGPYYVNASGGQVVGSLTLEESSNWNFTTGSGSLSVSGTLSKGAGGIALQNATIGTDSVIVVQNTVRQELLSATTPPLGISGVFDITNYTTSAYSYAIKFTIGTGVEDKSGELDLPSTVNLTGSIEQVGSGGALSPLFSGSIGLSFQGVSSFNVTQPISATNFLMAQVQIAGTLDLSNERVLTVTATANASQTTPTPKQPDSFSVTYSYSTPQGTTELNATGTYDATDGFSGTVTNNAGVVATVVKPITGSVTGAVTENGTKTAVISGSMIDYSDGTVESLY